MLGSNQTGLVQQVEGVISVVGEENPTLQQLAIPGQGGIAYGTSSTEGITVWPTATVVQFENHIGQVSVTISGLTTATSTIPRKSAGVVLCPRHGAAVLGVLIATFILRLI